MVIDGGAFSTIRPDKRISVTAQCDICWQSEEGEITATRGWHEISDKGFTEKIEVSDPIEGHLFQEQAKEYLNRVLPTDYLPFFFFDGEEVQHLAEANTNQTIAKMEQLLNIRPVENVLWGLGEIRRDLKTRSMDERAKAELEKEMGRSKQLSSELLGFEQEIADTEEERRDVEEHLKKLGKYLDLLADQGGIENRARLTAEIRSIKERQAQCLSRISEIFGEDGFLMITPTLTQKALGTLKQVLAQDRQSQSSLLNALKVQLPVLLEQPPYSTPRLTDTQIRFYQQRLRKQIEVFEGPVESNDTFQLGADRAQRLMEQLVPYRPEQGATDELSKLIRQARELKQQFESLDEKLDNANSLADEQRLEYEEKKAEKAGTEEQLLELNDRLRALESEVRLKKSERSKQDEKVKGQVECCKGGHGESKEVQPGRSDEKDAGTIQGNPKTTGEEGVGEVSQPSSSHPSGL